MLKPLAVKEFTYRGIRWVSGQRYRNTVFVFQQAFDKKEKQNKIQYATEFKDILPPFKVKRTRWVDFCKLEEAKDLVI